MSDSHRVLLVGNSWLVTIRLLDPELGILYLCNRPQRIAKK
jgi:hypothetical protein